MYIYVYIIIDFMSFAKKMLPERNLIITAMLMSITTDLSHLSEGGLSRSENWLMTVKDLVSFFLQDPCSKGNNEVSLKKNQNLSALLVLVLVFLHILFKILKPIPSLHISIQMIQILLSCSKK
jgi:hypothetical protein